MSKRATKKDQKDKALAVKQAATKVDIEAEIAKGPKDTEGIMPVDKHVYNASNYEVLSEGGK